MRGEPTRGELETLAAANPIPGSFVFGTAMAAFQNEGGFNGPGMPKNNFFEWEDTGRVERSGEATRFWYDPESHLDRAASIGCNGFRMSVEWARVFPSTSGVPAPPPEVDETALDRYAEIVSLCRDRGMEPLVTLHHFTHPAWLGVDAWTRRSTVDFFLEFVETVVDGINKRLGTTPLERYVTVNEPNGPGPTGYLVGRFPPGRYGMVREAIRVTDNLLAAHIRAYNAIHDIYETRGWPRPTVTTNTFATWTWGLERIVQDLLSARENGVEATELASYFEESRGRLRSLRSEDPNPPSRWRMVIERILDRIGDKLGPRHFPEAISTLYSARRDSCLDVVSIDYYDPYISNGIKMPGRTVGGANVWSPVGDFWEQVFNPPGFALVAKAATINARGKPVVIAENGLASKASAGYAFGRPDGVTRPVYIRRHLAQLYVAIAAGVPLTGYYHWTLADNYEWGSYEPRFGIYGVERSGDKPLIQEVDSMGMDSASAYKEAIAAIRSGDPSRIADELSR